MTVEAVDGEVELAVLVPADVEVALIERPVAGFRRECVPGQAARLVEPEAVGVAFGEVVELGELGGTDAGVEVRRNWVHRFAHSIFTPWLRVPERAGPERDADDRPSVRRPRGRRRPDSLRTPRRYPRRNAPRPSRA